MGENYSTRQLLRANRGNKAQKEKNRRNANKVLSPEELIQMGYAKMVSSPEDDDSTDTDTDTALTQPLSDEPESMPDQSDPDDFEVVNEKEVEYVGEVDTDHTADSNENVGVVEAEKAASAIDVTGKRAEERSAILRQISTRRHRAITQAEPNLDTHIPGIISLVLPQPVIAEYAAQKKDDSLPLRDFLAQRLINCRKHTAEKPLYANDQCRRELERIANRNFDSAEELLGWLLTTNAIHLGDVPLHLDGDLLDRVKFRMDADQSLGEALSEYLTAGIEIKTGMRS